MVDEITTALSDPTRDLPPGPNRAVGPASDGVSQAITAIALYPLLQVFRLLSKLASRSLVAGSAQHQSELISQDTDRAQNRRHSITDGPKSVARHPSPGIRAKDLAEKPNEIPAKVQIFIDASFDGVDPGSPGPTGKRDPGRRQVT